MRNIEFNSWIRSEVKDILKVNKVDWFTPVQFEILLKETQDYLSECDSPEEVEIESVVNFIFETSTIFKHTLDETVQIKSRQVSSKGERDYEINGNSLSVVSHSKCNRNNSKLSMIAKNIPIYAVTKGQRGRMRLRVFKDLRCPDKLITKRSSRIPYYDEIVALGVGKRFKEIYKKKYNLQGMKRIIATMREIYDAMKPNVYTNKKKYNRKDKHKNKGYDKQYK